MQYNLMYKPKTQANTLTVFTKHLEKKDFKQIHLLANSWQIKMIQNGKNTH